MKTPTFILKLKCVKFHVNKISRMNSTTIERSVRRILKFMFTDELLQNYSYIGFKKPKKSFSALLSCQVIIGNSY